ncbi:uncharacterized protein LOC117650692 [Thrips palmi]|uniref:Uncharacterized protein LOC117650692 n=1 Tax=Thrips palmi TaxID=161013 RepID=A0A6P8ZXM4_THRPL|nr:uncharacterized protein LOC117650692 [Thrips palmi]
MTDRATRLILMATNKNGAPPKPVIFSNEVIKFPLNIGCGVEELFSTITTERQAEGKKKDCDDNTLKKLSLPAAPKKAHPESGVSNDHSWSSLSSSRSPKKGMLQHNTTDPSLKVQSWLRGVKQATEKQYGSLQHSTPAIPALPSQLIETEQSVKGSFTSVPHCVCLKLRFWPKEKRGLLLGNMMGRHRPLFPLLQYQMFLYMTRIPLTHLG